MGHSIGCNTIESPLLGGLRSENPLNTIFKQYESNKIETGVFQKSSGPTEALKGENPLVQYLKYVNSITHNPEASVFDIIYTYERVKDIQIHRRTTKMPLSITKRYAEKRATIVDSIMSYAYDLQRFMTRYPQDISRASIQLAVSILDRSQLMNLIPEGPEGLSCAAAFCLVTALQFEVPNCLALESKLKEAFRLSTKIKNVFGIPMEELQRIILDRIECVISVPLSIDFAYHLLYKFDDAAFSVLENISCIQLVCYLLDCFALTPEYITTPSNLAAAACVQLAKRITFPHMPSSQLWTPYMESITGFNKTQLKTTLKILNTFLTTQANTYPGLKKLHEKGWAAVGWEIPAYTRKE